MPELHVLSAASTAGHQRLAQQEHYWLGVVLPEQCDDEMLEENLFQQGFRKLHEEKKCYVLEMQDDRWQAAWQEIQTLFGDYKAHEPRVTLLPCRTEPSVSEINAHAQPMHAMRHVTENLWLLEALEQQPIEPHYQAVVNADKEKIGYESLARLHDAKGGLISGDKIFSASHALNIEHIVDRYLHSRTMEQYIEHELQGMLFVNLVPGFIRKPSSYFDALTAAVEEGSVDPEHVVLDITTIEQVHDIAHLQKIAEHCQEAGFCIALDDLSSATSAALLIDKLRPEYAKLNQKLVRDFCDGKDKGELNKVVAIADEYNCQLVAIGVETEAQFKMLKQAGITLFQGYLFGKAVPIDEVK